MKRFYGTLISLGILVALGSAVYFIEFHGAEERKERASREKRILSTSALSMETLTIDRRDKGRVSLARKGPEEWEITEPLRTDADNGAAKSLVNRIQELEFRRVVDEEAGNLEKYGLKDPQIRVEIRGSGHEDILDLGKRGPIGNTLYLKKSEDPRVFLVDSGLLSMVDKGLFDLRERRIITFERNQVTGISLTYPDREIQLGKVDLQWRIREPGDYPADENEVNQILTELMTLKADKFVTEKLEQPSEYGFDEPQLTVAVALKNEEKASFRVGRKGDGGFYAHRPGGDPVYVISPESMRKLVKQVNDLREKILMRFSRDEVAVVEFARPATATIRIERLESGEDWKLTYPFPKEIPQFKMSTLFGELRRLRIHAFANDHPRDLTPYGFEDPLLAVRLIGTGERTIASLTVGKELPPGLRFVKTGEDPVYAIEELPIKRILAKIEELLSD